MPQVLVILEALFLLKVAKSGYTIVCFFSSDAFNGRQRFLKRWQWSARAAMRKRKPIQPRKLYRAEVDVFLYTADSNASTDNARLRRFCEGQ